MTPHDEAYIQQELLTKFEFYNYGHALEILHNAFPAEWADLQLCLQTLHLTLADIKKREGTNHPSRKNSMMCYIRWAGVRFVSAGI